jgi:WD40 repeat protein
MSPDGSRVAVAHTVNGLILSDRTLTDPIHITLGDGVPAFVSDDGRSIIIHRGSHFMLCRSESDPTLRQYQVRQFTGHGVQLRRLALSPDGSRIASIARDNTLRLWDAKTGRELVRYEIIALDDDCDLRFSPNGDSLYLATTLGDRPGAAVLRWDARRDSPNDRKEHTISTDAVSQ